MINLANYVVICCMLCIIHVDDDYALLIGIIKHGFGQWNKMDDDTTLPIFNNLPRHVIDSAKLNITQLQNNTTQSNDVPPSTTHSATDNTPTSPSTNDDNVSNINPLPPVTPLVHRPPYITDAEAYHRCCWLINNYTAAQVDYEPNHQPCITDIQHGAAMLLSTPDKCKQSTLTIAPNGTLSSSSIDSNKENSTTTQKLQSKSIINLNNRLNDVHLPPSINTSTQNKRSFDHVHSTSTNSTIKSHDATITSSALQPLSKRTKTSQTGKLNTDNNKQSSLNKFFTSKTGIE